MHTCPWCSTNYVNWKSSCDQCGGPLARPPGMEIGPRPPDAPRSIPKRYARKVMWTSNFMTLVGLGFVAVGSLFTIPFLVNKLWVPSLIGMFFLVGGGIMFWTAFQAGRSRLRAFRYGKIVEGKVRSVRSDTSVSVNNQNPYKLIYHFPVGDTLQEGSIVTFDSTAWERQPGQPLWVLYDEKDPENSAIYPPLA